jgi:nitrate/nitrite transport system ATP-binding protein
MASRPPDAPALALRGVTKTFATRGRVLPVLERVDFALQPGEFVAIVGFSGSGKTTLLGLLAGLLQPDAGAVEMDGAPAGGPGPERGVVFQSYALLPWLTALGNVELALGALPRAERRVRAGEMLAQVGLAAARDKRPAELSGGMRQRVAVARALAQGPRILLLDEPLGALDALTRASLQREIARIWERDRKSVVLITNDVDEAILLADRIVPLTPGPRASLGPSFRVGLPRPRDRAALNHDPAFRKLRNELTAYLLALGARRPGAGAHAPRTPLPALQPIEAAKLPRWRG